MIDGNATSASFFTALQWSQPLGLWRSRGASSSALRLGMGLPLLEKEKANAIQKDQQGYTLWHYWAQSPRPLDLWASVLHKIRHDHANDRSYLDEHPWHFLALRGQLKAIEQWTEDLGCSCSPEDLVGLTRQGDSLLINAIWSGNNELVLWLLKHQANPNQADDQGQTPLMLATHRGDLLTVQALIQQGADPDMIDQKGRSALHHAAQHESSDLYSLIEDFGGDPLLKDQQNQTPQQILQRTQRDLKQAELTQSHWLLRYQQKLVF